MMRDDPADHALFIDHQTAFDLACGCLAEKARDQLSEAIARAAAYWPDGLT